ncbi:unnamed protein product, partial [Polarella glacialis]
QVLVPSSPASAVSFRGSSNQSLLSITARPQSHVNWTRRLSAAAVGAALKCGRRRAVLRRSNRNSGGSSEAEYIDLEDLLMDQPLGPAHIQQLGPVVDSLATGGMGVIPTDTHQAYVTGVSSKEGTRRIYKIKGVAEDERKPLSLLCSGLSMASEYCDLNSVPRSWFKVLKTC